MPDRTNGMDAMQACREAYARQVVALAGADDPRLRAVFAAVPRERFMGPPPWTIHVHSLSRPMVSDDPVDLYHDRLVSLVRERSINNGLPSLHAACFDALRPAAGETVVHVGAGTGYYSALLAELVGPAGRVHAYEIDPGLAAAARANLQPWPAVQLHARSGVDLPLPEADIVYASAGATHPVDAWLDALKPGGRLLFPLTTGDGEGAMLLISLRRPGVYAARLLFGAVFIDCVGARDDDNAAALASALRTRPAREVRSFVRDEKPDGSAWCVGKGWWLSSRKPE